MAGMDEILTAMMLHPVHLCICDLGAAQKYCQDKGLLQQHVTFIESLESCYEVSAVHDALEAFRSVSLNSKPGTEEALSENKMLHDNFTVYWTAVHAHVLKKVEDSNIMQGEKWSIQTELNAFRKGQTDTFEAQQKAIADAIKAQANQGSSTQGGFTDNLSRTAELESFNVKAYVKEVDSKLKIKTRPSELALENVTEAIEHVNIEKSTRTLSSQTRIISVKAKTVELFQQMFSSNELLQKQRDWDDLVAAMVDAGCSAVHSGGSAVTFEDQSSGDKKASIVLHKPHPETTIYPIMLRSIGQRLFKRLGWDANTFVEREKQAA